MAKDEAKPSSLTMVLEKPLHAHFMTSPLSLRARVVEGIVRFCRRMR